MNYYTFTHFPNLDLETFEDDEQWRKAKYTLSYINAITIKLIWGFRDDGTWPISTNGTRLWFDRFPPTPTPSTTEPRIVLRTPFLRWP